MVAYCNASLLALAAVVAASADHRRKCRDTLTRAVQRLERPAPTPGTDRAQRTTTDAAMAVRTACVACGRCPGI